MSPHTFNPNISVKIFQFNGFTSIIESSGYIENTAGVVSGLPGAFYYICCLGFVAIFELRTIETAWPTND